MSNRRTSLRLSGGSSTAQLTPVSAKSGAKSGTAAPAGGADNNKQGRKRKSGGEETGVDDGGRGKRKKVAEMKPATTKRTKASTFNPVPLPSTSVPAPPPNASTALPPPPADRKPARRRSSARGLIDPSDSPLVVPLPAKKGRPVATANAAGKQKQSAPAAVAADGTEGLGLDEAGGSLEKELEGERRRWDGLGLGGDGEASMIQNGQSHSTPTKASALDFLTFETPSRPVIQNRPTTPHRTYLQSFATPRNPKSSRAKPTAPPGSTYNVGGSKAAANVSRDIVAPIQMAGTPVIKKNQAMRNEGGGGARRSSLGLRGARMSESLGKGDISTPHAAVPYATFFKHAASVLPEPVRARHLLVWLGKRAAEGAVGDASISSLSGGKSGKGKEKATAAKGGKKEEGTKKGDEMVKEIMERVWVGLARGEVDTNVFSPSSNKPGEKDKLRPHPANLANIEFQKKANKTLLESRQEEESWNSLISAANARLTSTLDHRATKAKLSPETSGEPAWVGEGSEVGKRKGWWAVAEEVLAGEDGVESGEADGEVEYKVDTLHQASHATLQFSLQATRFMDGIFESLNRDLQARENVGPSQPSSSSASSNPLAVLPSTTPAQAAPSNPIHLLRALALAEAGQQSEATVAQASQLPPLPRPVGVGVMTPRRAGAGGQTPRRAGVGTPGTGGRRGPYARPGSPS